MTDVDDVVRKLPKPFPPEQIAAQKRLANQLVAQMPADPRIQRAVVRYVIALIDWNESGILPGKDGD